MQLTKRTKLTSCAIMQPTYLPWIGYFDLIDQVDKFVFLDNVQVVRRSWEVRNRIKTSQGELLLIIPIKKDKHRDEMYLNNSYIDYDTPWVETHLKSIYFAYKKADYFDEIYPFLEKNLNIKIKVLSEFHIHLIKKIVKQIGIKKTLVKASSLKGIRGKKDKRLVSICKSIGCSVYISPLASSAYIEKNSPGGEFAKKNIELYYRDYKHPIYKQLYGNFMPYMSIIDLLFNVGFKKSIKIIRSGRLSPTYFKEASFRNI